MILEEEITHLFNAVSIFAFIGLGVIFLWGNCHKTTQNM